MVDYFVPSFVNPPSEDPSLYLAIYGQKRSLLVDCGVNYRLTIKSLQKVTSLFISHTHIDHFIGFDNLIRANIRLAKKLCVYGPQGITGYVHHKMRGYCWNLLCEEALEIVAFEVMPDRMSETLISYRDGFQQATPIGEHRLSDNVIYREAEFEVACAWLEHKIPCLGYAFTTHRHWQVDKDKLSLFAHSGGPWIKDLKCLLESDAPLTSSLSIEGQTYAIGELKEKLLIEHSGQKLCYVADTLYNEATEAAIVRLAGNADLFFCESHFAEDEANKARETCHLTARQAGMLARKAQAKRVIGFHYSPRYLQGNQTIVEKELEEAFAGKL
jgi:ribonuclease Z